MFDKMTFKVIINTELEAERIAKINDLQAWENGNIIRYENKETYKLSGIAISIAKNKAQIKCSLHKLFYIWTYGTSENSGLFTITEASRTLYTLFDKIGLDAARARITYFEIGLNIQTEHEPIQYIELIKSITTGKASTITKEMFNDANFRKNRQKTTEKTKAIKKYFKVYDKGFEMADRKRTEPTGEKMLRIETVYRRQSIFVSKFFEPDNIDRITRTFYKDWAGVEFERNVTADTGIKESEKEKAKNILLLGRENYLQTAKTDLQDGKITEKQYRIIREFIRDWNSNKHKYRMLPSEHETEYYEKLYKWFEAAKY
jgi:hypothetical protein